MRWNPLVAMSLTLVVAAGCSQPMRPDPATRADDGSRASASYDPAIGPPLPVPNLTPNTWWAGPDPSLWPVSTDGGGARSVDVVNWTTFQTTPPWPPDGRGHFGPDSFASIPVTRRPLGEDIERRTFYEIYGDRIYARSEGETVHLDSWVVLCNGGSDKDSPYTPLVDPTDPALPPGFQSDSVTYALLHNLGYVHSPIAFRSRITIRLPSGILAQTATSGSYPIFDPNSVFRLPRVMGYWRMALEGKAYAVAGALDAEGRLDNAALNDAVGIADRVDGGGGSAQDRALRRKIIVFNVAGP